MNKAENMREFIESVLDKSTEIILNRSFEEFEIHHLVKEIPYSKSKVYNYFGPKRNIVELLICNLLHDMKSYIQSRQLDENLDFVVVIGQIITLRSQFIDSIRLLKKYHGERSAFRNHLKHCDLLLQQEEDAILTEIIADYYKTDEDAITFLGLDFKQIWTCLFEFDTRNVLARNNENLEADIQAICFKK